MDKLQSSNTVVIVKEMEMRGASRVNENNMRLFRVSI